MIQAGVQDVEFDHDIDVLGITTFKLEISSWVIKNPSFTEQEFAYILGCAAAGVGEITSQTSWKSDRLNIISLGQIVGHISTLHCRIAMSLPTIDQKAQYITEHFKAGR